MEKRWRNRSKKLKHVAFYPNSPPDANLLHANKTCFAGGADVVGCAAVSFASTSEDRTTTISFN
jgi:hypothetical protein